MTESDMWYSIAVLFFVATDYLTGVIKAGMHGDLNSKQMRQGLGHKFAYLILTATSWFIDTANVHIHLNFPINLYSCTVCGISLIEITSILENITAINPELKNAPFMSIFTQNNTKPKHKED